MLAKTFRAIFIALASLYMAPGLFLSFDRQMEFDRFQIWASEIQSGERPPAEIGGTLSSGDWVGLKEHRGKTILVVYWSMNDPEYGRWDIDLREIRQKYLDNREFMILSICVDDDFEKWMKFLSDAKPLERNGERFELFRDKTWWHVHVVDHPPHKDLLDPEHPTVAHLVGPDGTLLSVRIPVKELRRTVTSKLGAAQ
jgi:hypothetical protein